MSANAADCGKRKIALTIFQGRTGDRNSRAMAGAALLGKELSTRVGVLGTVLGFPEPPLHQSWDRELKAARPALLTLAERYEKLLTGQQVPLTVMGRCASALATLPAVARHWPEACIVWFDAHADSNTPTSVAIPYIGGMVISGAAGMWATGLGDGLRLSNVVLVGSRDIDPDEQQLIDSGAIRLVRAGAELTFELAKAVEDRAVYVHLDCDVLEPGIVPTEYVSPNGLTLEDLRIACEILAKSRIIGLEIAEFEATWRDSNAPASPQGLLDSVAPLLDSMCR
jgi:arginase